MLTTRGQAIEAGLPQPEQAKRGDARRTWHQPLSINLVRAVVLNGMVRHAGLAAPSRATQADAASLPVIMNKYSFIIGATHAIRA